MNKGLKRNNFEKFYTNINTVKLCIKYIIKYLTISRENDMIIEPSAGNGSFISEIKELCNDYYFFDIKPEHQEIIQKDYLSFQIDNPDNKRIHIIGNPPFGRQSSLAFQFIRHSASFCYSISFILPKSFKKESMKNKFPLYFHCIFEKDLPENSFLLDNSEHNVPCVFQIWVKKDYSRKKYEKLKPIGYTFVKKNEKHDISFRRVGVNAGKIDLETFNKSCQSHYFILFDDTLFNIDLFNKLKIIQFEESNYTVGPKSISKQELIKKYNVIVNSKN